MLKKAASAPRCPKLWGVTVLTSMDQAVLRTVGINNSPAQEVLRLAGLAQNCGLNGVIASVEEVRKIKQICGKGFTVVTPGIRLDLATDKADQKRVATPEEAIKNGSDFIVVGRPILAANKPLEVVKEIYRRMRKVR